MEKLKELIEKYSRWKDLEKYRERIVLSLNNDFESAIGNTKSLIECICKTILDDQKTYQYTNKDKIQKLVTETIKALNINKNEEVSKFASGLITASHNLSELRNKIDTSSHGQSLLNDNNNYIEELTIYFLINSIEIMACFLIEFYEIEHPRKKQQKKIKYTYEDFPEFNEYLDNSYGNVNVTEIPYPTSEILFLIDQIAYENKYQEYLGGLNETNRR